MQVVRHSFVPQIQVHRLQKSETPVPAAHRLFFEDFVQADGDVSDEGTGFLKTVTRIQEDWILSERR
jgi:hypothetical protein